MKQFLLSALSLIALIGAPALIAQTDMTVRQSNIQLTNTTGNGAIDEAYTQGRSDVQVEPCSCARYCADEGVECNTILLGFAMNRKIYCTGQAPT